MLDDLLVQCSTSWKLIPPGDCLPVSLLGLALTIGAFMAFALVCLAYLLQWGRYAKKLLSKRRESLEK